MPSTAITIPQTGTTRNGRAIVTTNATALPPIKTTRKFASTDVDSGKTTALTTFVVRRAKPTDEKNEAVKSVSFYSS